MLILIPIAFIWAWNSSSVCERMLLPDVDWMVNVRSLPLLRAVVGLEVAVRGLLEAGLLHQVLRLRRAEGVARALVALLGRHEHPAAERRDALLDLTHGAGDDGLAVDAVGDGLTHLELGQVGVGLVEVEVLELEPRQRRLRGVRHLVGRLHDRQVHRRGVEDVDLLVLQSRYQLAVVGEELEDELVQLARGAPVGRVPGQDQRLVRVVARDRVPAARDGLGRAGEAGVPADGPGDVGRDDVRCRGSASRRRTA